MKLPWNLNRPDPLQILFTDGGIALFFAVLIGSIVGAATAAPIGLGVGVVVFLVGARITYGIATGYLELEDGGPIPRYRLRTWFRGHEPNWLSRHWVLPKGSDDCGMHEFYNADGIVNRCYHCAVGLRLRTEPTLATGDRLTFGQEP